MPLSPDSLFFLRPVIHMPPDLPERTFLGGCNEGAGLLEYLMGQTSFPKPFASQDARDHACGLINEYIEFLPTTWAEARAAGSDHSGITMG